MEIEQTHTLMGNIDTVHRDQNIYLKSKNSIFYDSYYFQGYYDDALIKKFISSTERLIRKSKEYNDYLALLKTNYNILTYDNCQSNINSDSADIEFHHYPFTLFNIVDIVMSDHIMKGMSFTSFSLSKEIMNLHFQHKIGFVPLTTTNHQLAHDNALFISESQIIGQWKEFMNEYSDGVTPEMREKIARIEKLSQSNVKSDFKGLY